MQKSWFKIEKTWDIAICKYLLIKDHIKGQCTAMMHLNAAL